MRTILLWMARNPWMKEHLPRLWFARRAVRRFMPGERVEDALEAAEQFRPLGIALLFTNLGENLERAEQANAVADHYHDLLAKIMARGLDAEISVKPTQLGLDLDADATLVHLQSLATHAADARGSLWLDMEGSAYTQATIDLYRALKADHPAVGICLQAYLKRTPADVTELMPVQPQIRLVKGAYDEPAEIAYRQKAKSMPPSSPSRGHAAPCRQRHAAARSSAPTTRAWWSGSQNSREAPASRSTPSRSRCCTASAWTSSAGWPPPAIGSAT